MFFFKKKNLQCKKKKVSLTSKLMHFPLFFVFVITSVGKESTCNAGNTGDLVSIPGSGRSPGAGNSNPLQYSFPEISMDRGAWLAPVQGVSKSQT